MRGNARTFALAVIFESALGFLAWGIARLTGVSLEARLGLSFQALMRGMAACLPMIGLLLVSSYSHWAPLVRLRTQVEALVRDLFGDSSWPELAAISLAAGVGEELLFRGVLQPWLVGHTGTVTAIVIVSLLFGLAHAISTAYFVAATLIGLYLGWLTEEYDDLVAPIIAHAIYDFVAILYIRHNARRDEEN